MAHFAQLDEDNNVIKVEVVHNSITIDSDNNEQEQLGINFLTELHGGGTYVQTSYNNNMRKNYACIGCVYDSVRDAFIKKQPYSSWILDEDTCQWNAPITEPEGTRNIWDELNGVWVKRF